MIFCNSGTIIFITSERISFLEYLSMQVESNIGIHIKTLVLFGCGIYYLFVCRHLAFILRSPPISYVSNIYYLPFTGVVWICTILLVITCTFVIAVTLKLHWSHEEETENMTSSDFLLFAIASSCQMGSECLTKILSARISMVNYLQNLLASNDYTNNICGVLECILSILVLLLHRNALHLHIIHGEYCGFITINNKIYSNNYGSSKPINRNRRS